MKQKKSLLRLLYLTYLKNYFTKKNEIMKNLITKAILFFLLFSYGNTMFGQVSGISYTISPTAEHVWWDDKAGLEDSYLIGGKLGFGFGQNFELRGSYMQSLNQKTNFNAFGLPNYVDSLFTGKDVELTRWGGEMKLNLSRGKLLPYLTAGTGIQSIQLDTFATNKQIYLSVGAGIILSVGDRLTLSLEGKNTAYRFNSGRYLLTQQDKQDLGVQTSDFNLEELKNWSALASLQLYLGGRRPGKMTELDKAYMNNFANGYKGLSLTVEPTVGLINWTDNVTYRDTRFAGGSAGFDFGPYVGIRGFYWQGMMEDDLTKRDHIAIYGGEVRTQLNAGTGLIPYLILGGGKIDVEEGKYQGKSIELADSTTFFYKVDDKPFAMGGVGLSIPFGRGFKVFGSARAMLTSGSPLEDIDQPSEIQTSMNYSAGVLLALGRKAKTDKLLGMEKEAAVSAAQQENDRQAALLKSEYENRINELESKLDKALESDDDEKAAELMEEKEEAEAVVEELSRREKRRAKKKAEEAAKAPVAAAPQVQITNDASQSVIRMTPGEFENLIEEILQGVNQPAQPMPWMFQDNMMMEEVEEEEMMDDRKPSKRNKKRRGKKGKGVDAKIDNLKKNRGDYGDVSEEQKEMNEQMIEILESMNKKMEAKDKEIEELQDEMKKARKEKVKQEKKSRKKMKDMMKKDDEEKAPRKKLADREYDEKFIDDSHTAEVQEDLKEGSVFRKMKYQGTSGFAGLNLGGSNTFNLGLRWHYDLNINDKLSFEFMPETFFGVGTDNTFGISANLLYPIIIDKLGPVKPYIGAGLGALRIEQENDTKLRGATNILIGSYLTVGKGRLYVDLTGRNLFKNNQLVAGYRFPF